MQLIEEIDAAHRLEGDLGAEQRPLDGEADAHIACREQHRRIRDGVVYKICGATRRDVLSVFGTEFLLVGLAAGVVSCATGAAAARASASGVRLSLARSVRR